MRGAILLAVVGALACDRSEQADEVGSRSDQESQTVRAEIERLATDYERWVAQGNLDSVATLLGEDAYVLPPNHPAIMGRSAWLAWARPMFAHGSWTDELTIESVVANGPLAVERGRYVMTFIPGPTSPPEAVAMSDTGKYVQHWHRDAGRWRMVAAILEQ
jgi:ketosteroid isomerase-like protein